MRHFLCLPLFLILKWLGVYVTRYDIGNAKIYENSYRETDRVGLPAR